MRAPGWVSCAMALWAGAAAAQPKPKDPAPKPVDIKEFREQLRVFQDPNGGTYVVLGEALGAKVTRVWFGAGKTLYEQLNPSRSRNGEVWSIAVYAPRVEEYRPGWIGRMSDGTYKKSCGYSDEQPLTELTGDKAKAALDASTFVSPGIIRVPHMLARDDRGVYYYVDRLTKLYGGQGFRVMVGKKGALKEMPLVDVASDSSGEVYATKSGSLRLVRTEKPQLTATWIKGKKSTELVTVDIEASERMIFRELGVYKFLGGFCDNI